MAALPYMQLYVADYLADTAHLNAAQHGAYLLLLMNYWQRGKPLMDSNSRLALVARMSEQEWNSNRDVLAEFFEIVDGEWVHWRVERDLKGVKGVPENKRKAGLASAAARKLKKEQDSNSCSNTMPTSVQQEANNTDTDTDTDTEQIQNKEKPAPRKRVGEPFVLPDWVPAEPWAAFVEMRRKSRATLTDYAASGIVRKLDDLRTRGHPPGDVLDQSTQGGWKGVFELHQSHANGARKPAPAREDTIPRWQREQQQLPS